MSESDCIWWHIMACDVDDLLACNECPVYLKRGTPEALAVWEKYSEDVEAALAPVHAKWRDVMESERMMRNV